MAASADLYFHLGDDKQLWRFIPHEPPGVIYNPADHTATIEITPQGGPPASYPAAVVDGGLEFVPTTATVIAGAGIYFVRWTASDGGLDLTFPNAAALRLSVTA